MRSRARCARARDHSRSPSGARSNGPGNPSAILPNSCPSSIEGSAAAHINGLDVVNRGSREIERTEAVPRFFGHRAHDAAQRIGGYATSHVDHPKTVTAGEPRTPRVDGQFNVILRVAQYEGAADHSALDDERPALREVADSSIGWPTARTSRLDEHPQRPKSPNRHERSRRRGEVPLAHLLEHLTDGASAVGGDPEPHAGRRQPSHLTSATMRQHRHRQALAVAGERAARGYERTTDRTTGGYQIILHGRLHTFTRRRTHLSVGIIQSCGQPSRRDTRSDPYPACRQASHVLHTPSSGWDNLSHGCQRADGIIPFGMIPWCSVGKRCSVGRQFSSPHPGRTTREGTMENSRTQSRRELLKHASVGAATVGAAWVVPQIHSSASAQSPGCSNLCTPSEVNLLGAGFGNGNDVVATSPKAVFGTAITFTRTNTDSVTRGPPGGGVQHPRARLPRFRPSRMAACSGEFTASPRGPNHPAARSSAPGVTWRSVIARTSSASRSSPPPALGLIACTASPEASRTQRSSTCTNTSSEPRPTTKVQFHRARHDDDRPFTRPVSRIALRWRTIGPAGFEEHP